MYRLFFILIPTFIFATNLQISALVFHNNIAYNLFANDILFVNDGIKFKLLSSVDQNISLYYKYNGKKKLLKKLILKSNTIQEYPNKNQTLKFDEVGEVVFSFENKKKLRITYTSNKINYQHNYKKIKGLF